MGAPGHAFYERLNQVLGQHKFDQNVERLCRRYYKGRLGRPSITPGVYFRSLLLGYFEGIDSERGIAWRLADSLSMRRFIAYALYRSTAQTSKQRLYYYRCLGSDAYRYRNGAVCDNRPIRQDYLDSFVWTEILRLLDVDRPATLRDPTLIQKELDRRMEAAKKADPLPKREESLQREQVRIQKNIDRLVTAYQEELVTLEQLRHRMRLRTLRAGATSAGKSDAVRSTFAGRGDGRSIQVSAPG